VLDDVVRAAVAPLEPGYADLLRRVVQSLQGDDRVRALSLAESVGRGVAGAGSDLDLVVTVTDVAAFTEAHVWDVVDPVITTTTTGHPMWSGCRPSSPSSCASPRSSRRRSSRARTGFSGRWLSTTTSGCSMTCSSSRTSHSDRWGSSSGAAA
jgi:hypothetical protein